MKLLPTVVNIARICSECLKFSVSIVTTATPFLFPRPSVRLSIRHIQSPLRGEERYRISLMQPAAGQGRAGVEVRRPPLSPLAPFAFLVSISHATVAAAAAPATFSPFRDGGVCATASERARVSEKEKREAARRHNGIITISFAGGGRQRSRAARRAHRGFPVRSQPQGGRMGCPNCATPAPSTMAKRFRC